MEPNRFDHLSRALAAHGPRRSILGLLAAFPIVGGLLGLLTPQETEAAGRRKRRKKAHKHGKGRRRKKPNKKTCTPDAVAQTCAGKCGSVQNNCKQPVDCGSCDCAPACGECFTCQGSAGAPGTCVPQETGTPCGDATICESGTLLPQSSCNGSGTCVPGTPVPCVPYTQCDVNACASSCADDDDCVAGSYCNGAGQCVGDQANGESCDHGGQCTSGFCADGVCCNAACDAACQACTISGSVGTCTTEPDLSTCGSGNVCCAGSCQACCSSAQCTAPQTCGGGGTAGGCGCTPTTCPAQNKNCGTIPDGCGGMISCGSCPFPSQPCTNNVCGACVPTSCAGKACGASNDCGGTCNACSPTCTTGTCFEDQTCQTNGTCLQNGHKITCTCEQGQFFDLVCVRSSCFRADDACRSSCASFGGAKYVTCITTPCTP